MGVKRNDYIVETNIYEDPSNPETSPYDTVHPVTVTSAVIDSETGQTLDEILSSGASAVSPGIAPGADLTVRFAREIAQIGEPWQWIKSRIAAGNFYGIRIGDYIPFSTSNGYSFKAEIAGIDTYFQYGTVPLGRHIDFISQELYPEWRAFNKANYNNGTSVSPSPWLASDIYAWLNSLQSQVPSTATANPTLTDVDYASSGVYDKLPDALKAVITPKLAYVPERYTSGALLTLDNYYGWQNLGNLWIPSEIEVNGFETHGSKNGFSSGGFQQYPLFAHNMKRVKRMETHFPTYGGERYIWWLMIACGGNSTHFAIQNGEGCCGGILSGATSKFGVPICFRIA